MFRKKTGLGKTPVYRHIKTNETFKQLLQNRLGIVSIREAQTLGKVIHFTLIIYLIKYQINYKP